MTGKSASRPLSPRLEQTNARGDRYVERLHRPEQRNLCQPIAQLTGELAQPCALPAKYPRDRAGQIGIEQALAAAGVGTDDPNAALLDLSQAPREIRDTDYRDRVRRA